MTRLLAGIGLALVLGGCSFAGRVHLGDVSLGVQSGGFATLLGAGHHVGIAIR